MSYNSIIKAYLKALQEQYDNAARSGQYTAELSYRMPLDTMERALNQYVRLASKSFTVIGFIRYFSSTHSLTMRWFPVFLHTKSEVYSPISRPSSNTLHCISFIS